MIPHPLANSHLIKHIYLSGCPDGSKRYTEGDRVICYYHIPFPLSTVWGDARDTCKQFITHPNADDADLAVIPSVDAKNFINDEFQTELG